MKVLITGATGFIGNYVVEEVLKRGHMVIATGTSESKAAEKKWFNNVTFLPYTFSVTESRNLFHFFQEPDLVIHLSWKGLPNYNQLFHINSHLFEQLSFIDNLVNGGLKNLTITGTCFEYGMQSGALHEELQTQPANAYALAKDSLRKFIEVLHKQKQFNFKWVRLFYMYGAGQSPNSLISLLDKAINQGLQAFNMSGGEQLRDYLHVEEVARIIVSIALQQNTEGIINCCSGLPVSVRSLVEKYIKEKNAKIELNLGYYPYPEYEPMAFWGDNTKLKKILYNTNV
jgi:nucleoside-diphosphate-sugar epimerase